MNFSKECPISLLPHQKKHVEKIWNLLTKDKLFSIIDTSKTGLGKTITSLYIAWHLQKLYGTQLFIVAPSDNSLKNDDGWLAHAKEFGIEVMASATYPSLRGGQGKVSHPWLIPDPTNKRKWVASKEFAKKCKEGLFLIFDEFHHTKNASITHFACAALVKEAKKHRSGCRVSLLSHTPGDKVDVYPQILRMSGIITSIKLFKHVPFTSEYEWKKYGFGELSATCKKIAKNTDASRKIENAMCRISAARANGICKELYDDHIRSLITFAMPEPRNPHKAAMVNAFLESDESSMQIFQDGLNVLSGAVGWDPVAQQVGPQNRWNLSNIIYGLKLIERGKLFSIANYVMEQSQKHPLKKFVICCGSSNIKHQDLVQSLIYKKYVPDGYKKVLFDLKKTNKNWRRLPKDMVNYIASFLPSKIHPEKLNGTVKKEERVKILRQFQEDSNNSWCLIVSPGTGSESISLHDKHGKRPREMIVIPDYYFGRLIQQIGRINRVGMKSDAKAMIVYLKDGNLETSILNSMVKKTKNAKDLMADDQKVVYPADFPYWIQGEKNKELESKLTELQKKTK